MRSVGEPTMSLGWRAGALLLTIALAAGCGGHGGGNLVGHPNPSGSPGGPTGGAAVIEFVTPASAGGSGTGNSADFEASIGPVGSSNPQASLVQFRVLNSEG